MLNWTNAWLGLRAEVYHVNVLVIFSQIITVILSHIQVLSVSFVKVYTHACICGDGKILYFEGAVLSVNVS